MKTTTTASECIGGGDHEWKVDAEGEFCVKCLENKETIMKASKKATKKAGKPEKNAKKAPAKKPAVKKVKPAAKKAAAKKAVEDAIKAADAKETKKAKLDKTAAKFAEINAKAAEAEKAAQEPKSAEPRVERPSLLNAAAKILAEGGELTTGELVKLAVERKLWEPGKGATPERTLNAAIHRELKLGGAAARFAKGAKRGTFRRA